MEALRQALDEADRASPRHVSEGGRRLLRDNLGVAAGTGLSRVTGVARLAALYVAAGPALRDAYILANNTPNIIYELILGGILTATLVPLFTAQLEHDDDEGTSAVVSVAIVVPRRADAARRWSSPRS